MSTLALPAMEPHHNYSGCPVRTCSAQPLGKVSQSLPLRGVHVDVLAVADVLVINDVVVHSLGAWERERTLVTLSR